LLFAGGMNTTTLRSVPLIVLVAVAACAPEPRRIASESPPVDVYTIALTSATPAELPACDAARAGAVAYVAAPAGLWSCVPKKWAPIPCVTLTSGAVAYSSATNTLVACVGGNWKPVALPPGPKGDKGDPGQRGVSSAIAVTPIAEGAECPSGGTRIEVGPDTDGSGALDPAEVTDVSYACNGADRAVCGNGVAEAGEECDSGAQETQTCTAQCKRSFCGDGHLNLVAGEQCDDGNTTNLDGCSSLCRVNVCGDGFVNTAVEQCDAGPQNGATDCPYGVASCTRCTALCRFVERSGNVCGDGIVAPGIEQCDDGNAAACGTCNASCTVAQVGFATGTIVVPAPAAIRAGDSFTIDDGVKGPVTFEFVTDPSISVDTVQVTIPTGGSAVDLARAVSAAIESSPLRITAVASGAAVHLTHDAATALGNVPITETVADPTFTVLGMSGGRGGDCGSGVSCKTHQDCASGRCGGAARGVCD
jgi:cysteine-rich repeat protein